MSETPTPIAEQRTKDLLNSIATRSPAPGGGATACLAGALAAAQLEMVVAYSIGRADLEQHQDTLRDLSAELERLRELLLGFADEDAAAFEAASALRRKAREDPGSVDAHELVAAERRTLDVPRSAMAAMLSVLERCERTLPISNPRLRSDVLVAAAIAEAGVAAAACNVRVNLDAAEDDRAAIEAESARILDRAAACRARVLSP